MIRPATQADASGLAEIYAHYVLHSVATFEEEPPDAAEMQRRWESVAGAGLPFLVASDANNQLVGFAYASGYRARVAYRHTVESSVYIRDGHARRGLGRTLMQPVLEACRTADKREVLAVIGGSDNLGSVRLHTSLGFVHSGTLMRVGYKFGRWVDTVLMQCSLRGAG